MIKIAFITGITGQDGSYLTELLIEKGYKVYGIVRRTSSLYNDDRLKEVRKYITLRYGDMTDGAALQNYIHEIIHENKEMERFEIYNLAAQSHVKISFEIPEYTSLVDGIGTLKLLEIIRTLPKKQRDNHLILYHHMQRQKFMRTIWSKLIEKDMEYLLVTEFFLIMSHPEEDKIF
jgi:GDPmannose 4,6-dehydratase